MKLVSTIMKFMGLLFYFTGDGVHGAELFLAWGILAGSIGL